MKKLLFIVLVGIAITSCSPEQEVTIITNNYYSKKTTPVQIDPVTGEPWETINDSIAIKP